MHHACSARGRVITRGAPGLQELNYLGLGPQAVCMIWEPAGIQEASSRATAGSNRLVRSTQ
jgi:hypothetical protein